MTVLGPLSGVFTNHPGYRGMGFVDMLDWVEFTVNGGSGGDCELSFRYSANGLEAFRPCFITLNGIIIGTVQFVTTGDWDIWKDDTIQTTCNSGTNVIRITSTGNEGPNLDGMKICEGPCPTEAPTSTPSMEPSVSFQPSYTPSVSFVPSVSHHPSASPTMTSSPSSSNYYRYATNTQSICGLSGGQFNIQGPEPLDDGSNTVITFHAFGDTPYDRNCPTCNTCIAPDGVTKEQDCERFNCILENITMTGLPEQNTWCVNFIVRAVSDNIFFSQHAFLILFTVHMKDQSMHV